MSSPQIVSGYNNLIAIFKNKLAINEGSLIAQLKNRLANAKSMVDAYKEQSNSADMLALMNVELASYLGKIGEIELTLQNISNYQIEATKFKDFCTTKQNVLFNKLAPACTKTYNLQTRQFNLTSQPFKFGSQPVWYKEWQSSNSILEMALTNGQILVKPPPELVNKPSVFEIELTLQIQTPPVFEMLVTATIDFSTEKKIIHRKILRTDQDKLPATTTHFLKFKISKNFSQTPNQITYTSKIESGTVVEHQLILIQSGSLICLVPNEIGISIPR